MKSIKGNIVDLISQSIFSGIVHIKNGKIKEITKNNNKYNNYILPGFIDTHIHIESSCMPPSEFARAVIPFGTVATVSDCHEIANVMGVSGINYMIKSSKKVPLKIFFGVPSCVPATEFDTSGAKFGTKETNELLKRDELFYMGEFMDLTGIEQNNPTTYKKIELAKKYKKPIDGHLPVFNKDFAKKYIKLGISTDHETITKKDAIFKIKHNMKIQIREGSACKNFDDLIDIIKNHYKDCMFCSDDSHPNELLNGHMNLLVKRAISLGYDPLKVLTVACVNPVKHYNLPVGLLQVGDPADFIEVNNLKELKIKKSVINGITVFDGKKLTFDRVEPKIVNNFVARPLAKQDLLVKAKSDKINVIELVKDQIVTKKTIYQGKIKNGFVVSDIKNDILKIVYMNRYKNLKPKISFIKGFGFSRGAVAESVSHDSHNIVAVGANDDDLLKAINSLISQKGGFFAIDGNKCRSLPLSIAGLMSNLNLENIVKKYEQVNRLIEGFGSTIKSPLMTLGFMALLVVPALKIGEKGLFDTEQNRFIGNFV